MQITHGVGLAKVDLTVEDENKVVVKCASAGGLWILQSYKLKIQIGIYISRPKSNPMDVVKSARARSDDHTLKG